MIVRSLVASLVVLAAGSAASAQTAGGDRPAAPLASGAQPLGGPVVPGVCLLSREAIFANAAVGKAASARLAELTRAAQAEIDAERAPLEAEAQALEGQADSPQIRTRRQALAENWQALQRKAAHTSREIDATRAKALERIANEAQPVIAEVYAQKNCGLLFDRNSALGGNFANDLTADVVRALDANIRTIDFERERLPDAQPEVSAPAVR